MRALSGRDCLELYESGQRGSWLERGLLLLSRAWTGSDPSKRSKLPISIRDRLLLRLRIATWGGRLEAHTTCGECGTELEAELDLLEVMRVGAELPPEEVPVRARLPSTDDVMRVLQDVAPEAAAGKLALRCLLDTPTEALTEDARESLSKALSEADPFSKIEFEFACRDCGSKWSEVLDVVQLLWREVEKGAGRSALEVHLLASAYGWSEREILQMSSSRRRMYLSLVER